MFSSVFLFLNIGTPELMLIMFVALLLFGGDKLPGIAKGLGKGIRDFKDASEGVKREINNQINNYDEKKPEQQVAVLPETTPEPAPQIKPLETAVPVAEYQVGTDEVHEQVNHTPVENHTDVNSVSSGINLTKATHE